MTVAWTTPERASRVLRMFILLLMALIPLAAIYVLAAGGPPPRGDMFFRMGGPGRFGPGPMGTEMPPPPMPGFVGREVQETCNTKDGVRTCTRVERDLKPGEKPHAEGPAPAQPAAPLQHSGLIKADYLIPAQVIERETRTFDGPPPVGPARLERPMPPPGLGAPGMLALAVLALIFVLGVLFNIERLLYAFEKGQVFAEATVRRLQHTGLFVAALGFLPQIDIFALLHRAGMSLLTQTPPGPLPLAAGGINIALIMAGVLTVLIARIVHEANALAEDVRGTV